MGLLLNDDMDTSAGQPAGGMAWVLYRAEPQHSEIASGLTNIDGRNDGPVLEGADFTVGTYELVFMAGDYFRSRGVDLPEPPFLDRVVLRFGISEADNHYHVPLLVSPYGYSTYRGS